MSRDVVLLSGTFGPPACLPATHSTRRSSTIAAHIHNMQRCGMVHTHTPAHTHGPAWRQVHGALQSSTAIVVSDTLLRFLAVQRTPPVCHSPAVPCGSIFCAPPGACADMYVEPAGALAIGAFSGVVSVLGYMYLTPYLQRKINLLDTCGIHNLHGMPGVLSAICSAIIARVCTHHAAHRNKSMRRPGYTCMMLCPRHCRRACACVAVRRQVRQTTVQLGSRRSLSSDRRRRRRSIRFTRCW